MSTHDLERYKCQLNLAEIGKTGQNKLANASVLCVGAGGLANAALPYLAAAGIGKITIVDGDVVSTSNLHRQICFNEQDVGQNKAVVITEKLSSINPFVTIVAHDRYLDLSNAESFIAGHDVVLDCSDNYFTRYLVSDVCCKLQTPDIFAAVIGFEGYITIFKGVSSPCYRCLYPSPPMLENVGNCNDLGVLGTVPGLFGLMQATEAIKYLLNISTLQGKLFKMNFLDFSTALRTIHVSSECVLCDQKKELTSIDRFEHYATHTLKKIKPSELDRKQQHYFCLDVREPDEYQAFNLGYTNLPFSSFTVEQLKRYKIDKNTPLLVCCAHGMRSRIIASKLQASGYNVEDLEGGIESYRAMAHA